MALKDPVVVYDAANNVEAQFLSRLLEDRGVEAFASEDASPVGLWMGGFLPGIHKPRVWVDRSTADLARTIIAEYEQHAAAQRQLEADGATSADAVLPVECHECGQLSQFAAKLKGTVQDCPHCGAYIDVEEPASSDEWWREDVDDGTASPER